MGYGTQSLFDFHLSPLVNYAGCGWRMCAKDDPHMQAASCLLLLIPYSLPLLQLLVVVDHMQPASCTVLSSNNLPPASCPLPPASCLLREETTLMLVSPWCFWLVCVENNNNNNNQWETTLVQFSFWTNLLLPSPWCSKPGGEETSVVVRLIFI